MKVNEEQYTAPASSEPNNSVLEKSAGKQGGPRTRAGKLRSKYNATKHAIFSNVAVLKTESRRDYTALLEGLRESFQPVGMAEDMLVERLATLAWRQRRLLRAEGAEIERLQDLIKCDEMDHSALGKQAGTQEKSLDLSSCGGLLRPELNTTVLDECLGLLAELRDRTKTEGVNAELARSICEKIYGGWSPRTFILRMFHNQSIAEKLCHCANEPVPFEVRAIEKSNLLYGIEMEMSALRRFKEGIEDHQASHKKQAKLRHSVLDFPALDRLMRYEAHLSRLEDRTLGQLERLQRIRLGQPVPPPVKLEVSRN